jgi:hypothetical protein
MKEVIRITKEDVIRRIQADVSVIPDRLPSVIEALEATDVKFNTTLPTNELGCMIDTEPFQIILYKERIEQVVLHDWAGEGWRDNPIEFTKLRDIPARAVALSISTMYHEFRHVYSAIFERFQGKTWYETYLEKSQDGYENNIYEKMAMKFQKLCWPTCQKFITPMGTLARKIEWP